jgi:hypothetical protein
MESYYREISEELLSKHTQTILTPVVRAFNHTAVDTKNVSSVDSVDESEEALKTYTCFSGCDIVVSAGTKIYGEVSSIMYHETTQVLANLIAKDSIYCDKNMVKNYPNVVAIKFTVFNKEYWYDEKEIDITLTYANDCGQKAIKSIVGCVPLFRYGGTSVDAIVSESIVVYAARKIFPMEEAI